MMRTTEILFSALLLSALAATPSTATTQSSSIDTFGPFRIEAGADLSLAAGAGDTDPVSDGLLVDLDTFLDAEAITDSGLRWGARFRLRAQRDHGRSGFADRAGDCALATSACPVSGTILLRSLATGRYVSAPRPDEDGRVALESAHVFVRGGWGEVRAGLGPGAASVEALPGVSAMRTLRLDGGALDPGGHAAIRTANTASGFSPRLLVQSQRIVGLRVTASFAPDADACGVDTCNAAREAVVLPGTTLTALSSSRLENAAELAVSFDHTFARKTRIEAALSVLHADPADPAHAGDHTAWQVGVRVERDSMLFGLSLLDAGDYAAMSAGAALDRGQWRFGVEAGLSDDSLIHESQRAVQFAASRLIGDHALVGFAIRHEDTRFSRLDASGQRRVDTRDGVSVLLEAGLRY